jgi:hypothetical protein
MLAQHGESCITQRKVYQWVEGFQSGRTSIVDEDHLGCLTNSVMEDSVELVNGLVQEDRRITVTDIANKLDINCGFAHSIIPEDIGYRKIYTG